MKKELFRQFDNFLKNNRHVSQANPEGGPRTERTDQPPALEPDGLAADARKKGQKAIGRAQEGSSFRPRPLSLTEAQSRQAAAAIRAVEARGEAFRREMLRPKKPNWVDHGLARLGSEKAKESIAHYELWQWRERYAQAKNDQERFLVLIEAAKNLYKKLTAKGADQNQFLVRYGLKPLDQKENSEDVVNIMLTEVIGNAPFNPSDPFDAVSIARLAAMPATRLAEAPRPSVQEPRVRPPMPEPGPLPEIEYAKAPVGLREDQRGEAFTDALATYRQLEVELKRGNYEPFLREHPWINVARNETDPRNIVIAVLRSKYPNSTLEERNDLYQAVLAKVKPQPQVPRQSERAVARAPRKPKAPEIRELQPDQLDAKTVALYREAARNLHTFVGQYGLGDQMREFNATAAVDAYLAKYHPNIQPRERRQAFNNIEGKAKIVAAGELERAARAAYEKALAYFRAHPNANYVQLILDEGLADQVPRGALNALDVAKALLGKQYPEADPAVLHDAAIAIAFPENQGETPDDYFANFLGNRAKVADAAAYTRRYLQGNPDIPWQAWLGFEEGKALKSVNDADLVSAVLRAQQQQSKDRAEWDGKLGDITYNVALAKNSIPRPEALPVILAATDANP